DGGLPEVRATEKLAESGGALAMPKFVEWAKGAGAAVNDVLKWGAARGWIERVAGQGPPPVRLTSAGKEAAERRDDDLRLLEHLGFEGSIFLDELEAIEIDAARVRSLLAKRA